VRDELFIIGLILGNPVLYLEEICREVDKVLGKQVSAPTVCRLLAGYGFTRKKVQAIAKQRSDKFRGAFIAEMHCYSRDQLVWIDEMGCDRRDYVRRYGHALRGQVPVCHRLLHRGQRYSSIAALSSEGIVAVESHTGSTNADNFADDCKQFLFHQCLSDCQVGVCSFLLVGNEVSCFDPSFSHHLGEGSSCLFFCFGVSNNKKTLNKITIFFLYHEFSFHHTLVPANS